MAPGRRTVGRGAEHRQQELPTNQAILDEVEKRVADYERNPSTSMKLEEFKHKFRLS